MNIAYCSLLLPEEKRLAERARKRLSGISGHKVMSATIKGIEENLTKPVTIFNIINTLNYPNFPQLCFKTESWSHARNSSDWHIGYLNLFGVKYITQAFKLRRLLLKWVKSLHGEKCIICVHHTYFPSMFAAFSMKARFGEQVKLCLNTGDIPGKYGLVSQSKPSFKRFLTDSFVNSRIMRMAQSFDCFVFVTKEMASAFNVGHKPYAVVEGVYSESNSEPRFSNFDLESIKTVFYAGALRDEYGIGHLLRAFSMIEDNTYRLIIAGGGSAEDEVRRYAKRDSRINFLGFITPKEVQKEQQKATVIVNPRTSDLEFVKYSFPSKSLDALASGVPYVAHRLPCDPPEYANHIQYTSDESDEALKDKLIEIAELSRRERLKIGAEARDFILKMKNPAILCKRIVDMWEEVI